VATPQSVVEPAFRQAAPLPSTPSTRFRRLRAGLLVSATATLTITLLPGTATASPDDIATSDEAAALVAEAGHELEVVTEKFNETRELLKQQQTDAEDAATAAAEAKGELEALDGQIRTLARTAYTGRGYSSFALMMSSDSADEFLSSLGTLDVIAGHTNDLVAQVTAAAKKAEDAKSRAETEAKKARRTLEKIEAQQADLRAQIAEFQDRYDSLSAAEQQQVDQSHAGDAVASPSAAPAPSGAAQIAVDTAMAQRGDPYVWGAAGPDAFDCSGLTQYAYAAAGVSLPHSSRMQSQMGTPVSRSQLQPGDLVFFYQPVSHVAMYIGNGQIVHASTSGRPVEVANLDSMTDYVGARRMV
jgi:cell wall-associated NlpC family hydrolase